jgi:outer membrane protein assembly factor BamB
VRFKADEQVLASPALGDGALFLGADDRTFYAIEQATGKLRWKHAAGGEFTGGATVVGALVLVGHSERELLAYDTKSGAVVWKVKTAGGVASTPAADSEHVYFGDDAGHFYKVKLADGSIVTWADSREGGGENVRCPAAVHEDVVYFSTGDPDGGQKGLWVCCLSHSS